MIRMHSGKRPMRSALRAWEMRQRGGRQARSGLAPRNLQEGVKGWIWQYYWNVSETETAALWLELLHGWRMAHLKRQN